MEDTLVSFQVAKLAKEKGFNIHCMYYYEDNQTLECNEKFPYNSFDDELFAPTQSLLAKWLREVRNIHISTWYDTVGTNNGKYHSKIYKSVNTIIHGTRGFKSYELALEEGLLQALQLIK